MKFLKIAGAVVPAVIAALPAFLTVSALSVLTACTAVGDVAYSSALEVERERCRRLESMPERQSCLEKLRQAEAARPRP